MSNRELNISSRALKVLEAVIEGFMLTGKPVGSRSVVRNSELDCSSATVRNEMTELCEMGHLKQTHVSSGRVPTSKGIRAYLDNLMREERLSLKEMDRLRSVYPTYGEDFRATVRNAGRVLADLTHQAGVVLMPGLRQMPLRHIEFIRLTSNKVMALLISEGGRFYTRVFKWGQHLEQRDLTWASNYLNDRFQGMGLSQIREKVINEMRREKAEYNRQMARALGLMETVLQQGELDEELFIEGRENLAENPEFSETENMLRLFKTFEEKSFILKLLSKTLEGDQPSVLLSPETGVEDIPEFAIIAARYGAGGAGGGSLGILGPIRMNYARVVPMVRYSAKLLSDLISA